MNTHPMVTSVRAALLAAGLGLVTCASATIYPQCPGYNGGTVRYYDPVNLTHLAANVTRVCLHLAAGDGFITLGDGTRSYSFGFSHASQSRAGTLPNAQPDGFPARSGNGNYPYSATFNDAIMNTAYLNAQFSAPPLNFRQGQEVFISLTNANLSFRPDLFDSHSVHWHGFPQAAPFFDGVPESSATISAGSTFTYYYLVAEQGTFMYHCHVESAEHMQMGMLGVLNVMPSNYSVGTVAAQGTGPRSPLARPATGGQRYAYGNSATTSTAAQRSDASDTTYAVEYSLQLGGFDQDFHGLHELVQPLPFANLHTTHGMINGRGYPHTVDEGLGPVTSIPEDATALPGAENRTGHRSQPESARVTVKAGTKALLRVSNLGMIEYYSMTLQGIPMTVVGYGSVTTRGVAGALTAAGDNWAYKTTTLTLGGGESADVMLDATGVPPGTYYLYSSNLNFLSNGTGEDRGGLMTQVVVTP